MGLKQLAAAADKPYLRYCISPRCWRENSRSKFYIFTKRQGLKNVGLGEGDINFQPKKQFIVQNICICEEIDFKYIWWKSAKKFGQGPPLSERKHLLLWGVLPFYIGPSSDNSVCIKVELAKVLISMILKTKTSNFYGRERYYSFLSFGKRLWKNVW